MAVCYGRIRASNGPFVTNVRDCCRTFENVFRASVRGVKETLWNENIFSPAHYDGNSPAKNRRLSSFFNVIYLTLRNYGAVDSPDYTVTI